MAGVKELLELVDSGLQKNAAEEVVIAGLRMCVCVSKNMRAIAVSSTCVCVCVKGGFDVCVWGRWVRGCCGHPRCCGILYVLVSDACV